MAFYILNHYDVPCQALAAEGRPAPDLDEHAEEGLKLEAASSCYRLVDELAFKHIKQERGLFSDYIQDSLAELLALQGAAAKVIVRRMVDRSTEYGSIRDWNRGAGDEPSSLLWQMGKHSLAVLGAEEDVPSIRAHIGLLLRALDQAMLRELLTGL